MKVLQVCNKPPFPPVDGGCMAMAANALGLQTAGADLKIVSASTHKHPWKLEDWPDSLKDLASHSFLDTEVRMLPAFKNLLGSGSYNIERFYSKELEHLILKELAHHQPEVVLLESLFMTPYVAEIRKASKAKVVLRAHNVEHMIWRRLAENEANPIKKRYLSFLADRLNDYERNAIETVDGIAAISEEDAEFFRSNSSTEVEIFPAGIDVPEAPFVSGNNTTVFFHLGDMNWAPNEEALDHFINDIWPLVGEKLSNSKVVFAGRGMPASRIKVTGNLEVKGDVESAKTFMKEGDVMLLPLKSGGGMRVKLIEAMSLGKCVITTSLGAEGLKAEDRKHLIIANTPEEFSDRMKDCETGQIDVNSIGKQAQELIRKNYDRSEISQRLFYFCQRLARS